MRTVSLGVGHVVEQVGGAGKDAEQQEGEDGVHNERGGLADPRGTPGLSHREQQGKEDDQVLHPLLGTQGDDQGPGRTGCVA